MPRGGRRTGTPGQSYSNRSDLAGKVPISAASGQTYGAKAAQVASQRSIPIAAPPQSTAPASMALPGGAPAPGPGGAGGLAALLGGGAPAAPPVLPGEVTPLHAPSERPDEHVMHGAPMGPGGGPEVLGDLGTPAQAQQTARDQVTALSQADPNNPALAYLAAQLSERF